MKLFYFYYHSIYIANILRITTSNTALSISYYYISHSVLNPEHKWPIVNIIKPISLACTRSEEILANRTIREFATYKLTLHASKQGH